MLQVTNRQDDIFEVRASGRLSRTDYTALLPQLEGAIESQGKLRLLVALDDFKGWNPSGLLEDLRLDFKHRKDFKKIAVVGESRLEKIGTQLTRSFFSGEVRYFDRTDSEEAEQWLRE